MGKKNLGLLLLAAICVWGVSASARGVLADDVRAVIFNPTGEAGSDFDEHGCKPSAGYSWCAAKSKCLRTWEEACPSSVTSGEGQTLVGGDVDEHGCLPSAGYAWCAAKNKCLRPWEEACAYSEGDIVKTADNPDVYIIKYKNGKQYKRLILSPGVFRSYRHLRWENLKVISQAQLDTFVTSNLVQVAGDRNVYALFPKGDKGERRVHNAGPGYDADSVYEINSTDRNSYVLVR
jgi:hypothetical protein